MSVLTDNTAKLRKILEKVENLPEIPGSVAQATPSITVSSGGLITASATQEAGVVASGTKSATRQLTTKGGTTITPGTSEQTAVSAGTYVTGDIKVAATASGKQVASGSVSVGSATQVSISPGFVVDKIMMVTNPGYGAGSYFAVQNISSQGKLLIHYVNGVSTDKPQQEATITQNNASGFKFTVPVSLTRTTWWWIATSV